MAKTPANVPTPRQVEVLLFMWDFYEKNDQLPPCEAIASHFNWVGSNAAYCHQDALERKGWIERNVTGKFKFSALTRIAMQDAEAIDRFAATEAAAYALLPVLYRTATAPLSIQSL